MDGLHDVETLETRGNEMPIRTNALNKYSQAESTNVRNGIAIIRGTPPLQARSVRLSITHMLHISFAARQSCCICMGSWCVAATIEWATDIREFEHSFNINCGIFGCWLTVALWCNVCQWIHFLFSSGCGSQRPWAIGSQVVHRDLAPGIAHKLMSLRHGYYSVEYTKKSFSDW